jgi:ABC-type phosphate/phosphonate transport system substrate-binding protein
VFVTRSSFPAADVARLRAALLELKSRPEGPELLERLHHGLSALVPAAESDYRALREVVRRVDASER